MVAFLVPTVPFGQALEFQYIGFSESVTDALSLPTGAATGDFAVYCEYAQGLGSRPSLVTPSGWTNLVNNTDIGNNRSAVFRKVLTAGDVSAGSITGMADDFYGAKLMLLFRPNSTIVTTTDSTWTSAGGDGNLSSQSIAASGQTPPLLAIGFACVGGGATVDPFSWSPAYDALVTPVDSANSMRGAYKIYNAAPASHTIDMDDEGGGNFLTGGYSRFT